MMGWSYILNPVAGSIYSYEDPDLNPIASNYGTGSESPGRTILVYMKDWSMEI